MSIKNKNTEPQIKIMCSHMKKEYNCPCFAVMRGVLGVSRCVFAHINPIPKPNQKLLNSETYRNPIQNKKLLNSETYRNPIQNPGNQTATGLPGFWMGFRWVSVGFGRFRWVSVGFGGFRWVLVGFGGFRY